MCRLSFEVFVSIYVFVLDVLAGIVVLYDGGSNLFYSEV